MTDPQLTNNNNNNNNNNNANNNNNNNNNNDGEPKYLHKKFKKMATTESAVRPEPKKDDSAETENSRGASSESPTKKDDVANRTSDVKDVKSVKESSRTVGSPESESEPTESRKVGYVCPYCKLSCAKPSVLQKHIRAHTNERPYPCVPCGFAFKTKSNLYKHCRSRSHALKMEGGDASKVSEDSDISLSDSASNGTGTPPPPPTSAPNSISSTSTKTVKTGKIYKPKFHTGLQHISNETEASVSSSVSPACSTNPPAPKPNAEQLQEHIDKIITDNQAIVEAVDPRLHKLMHRQQSLVETKHTENQQPLNLSSIEEATARKRCYSESFAEDNPNVRVHNPEGSIIKDLLLKSRGINSTIESPNIENDNLTCQSCKIAHTSLENLEAHRRYYCKSVSPIRPDFQLDLGRPRDDYSPTKSSDYYSTIQPLPSPGPLLGNTRLVDAYAPPPKKQRSESVPTSLRSLEELSKYPRPNSLQMFGGEVRILDNTGETKTMRIEPRQTNSPSEQQQQQQQQQHSSGGDKCVTTETASIVVRSGLHSGGTMVHKPPGGISTPSPVTSKPNSSISLSNNPQMLAPIIPNISTPNIAPTMSCYNYLEPHLNPLTNITAYNPLTLPQAGIASILHAGKVIPYVPGMPGPHSLATPPPHSPHHNHHHHHSELSQNVEAPSSYKIIPGLPGLHMISQPLDLASPVRPQQLHTPNVPGIPGPLDLASPAKEIQNFKTPCSNNALQHPSPKVPKEKSPDDMERTKSISTPVKYKLESPRDRKELIFTYPNGESKRLSENRKRSFIWSMGDTEIESPKVVSLENCIQNAVVNSSENGRIKETPVIVMNVDETDLPNKSPVESADVNCEKNEARTMPNIQDEVEEEETSTKFLRPSSLPLKPGTFTPKRHHGITPTANTLPLISPETPRPRKSYGQLYLNGHAYTYLGLKCSTRVFYCTLNRPQPMYVTQQGNLSMYSNWKICKEAPPDLGMGDYDSRNREICYTIAWKKQVDIMTHSSQIPHTPTSPDSGLESDTQERTRFVRLKIFDGGFETTEDYTYVRGRGRGRYVCEECGIRCKKPSMLKKHIRTHTDVRPYTCKHCSFSFKTKGNLTKHMKSKAHYKKCVELGVVPVPTSVCDENINKEAIARLVAGGGTAGDSSSDEDDSEGDYSDESGSEEQEAAQSLLSLSHRGYPMLPGLLSGGRPTTYPYALTFPTTSVTTSLVSTFATTTVPMSVTSTTVIQSEVSNRYYFPSNRSSTTDECRDSVIHSSISEENDDNDEPETPANLPESEPENRHQPMDLTTKSMQSPQIKGRTATDILTPVSEPILMQTLVQSMERLPPQGREWKPDADGHMLQAYLTERHVMDSKIKQQYRVAGTAQPDRTQLDDYSQQQFSRSIDSCSTPTVTYTDPSRLHQSIAETRNKSSTIQSEVAKIEIRDKIYQQSNGIVERRSFDIESSHRDMEINNRHNHSSPHRNISVTAGYNVKFSGIDRLSPKGTIFKSEEDRSVISHNVVAHEKEHRESVNGLNAQALQEISEVAQKRIQGYGGNSVHDREHRESVRGLTAQGIQELSEAERTRIEAWTVVHDKEHRESVHDLNAQARLEISEAAQKRIQGYAETTVHDKEIRETVHGLNAQGIQEMSEAARKRIQGWTTVHDLGHRESVHDLSAQARQEMSEAAQKRIQGYAGTVCEGNEIRESVHGLTAQGIREMSEAAQKRIQGYGGIVVRDKEHRESVHGMNVQVLQEMSEAAQKRIQGYGGIVVHDREHRESVHGINAQALQGMIEAERTRNQENGGIVGRSPSRSFRGGIALHDMAFTSQESKELMPPPSQEFKSTEGGGRTSSTPPVTVLPSGVTLNVSVASIVGEQAGSRTNFEGKGSETRNSEIKHTAVSGALQHTVARNMVVGGPGFRSPSPSSPGGSGRPQAEFLQPSNGPLAKYITVTEDGRSLCRLCNKVFNKASQVKLHIDIHCFERPFRCESCAVSFRTKGHLTKHERSVSHHNKVSMASTFGAATTSNPRPFKCTDCQKSFRIHGHLAKHLRSKMHIMKLECLGKLPFGTYAEMERSGINLNDIDTTDCDNSLTSLQILAQKLYEKDPSRMSQWDAEIIPHQVASGGETSSDEGEPIPSHSMMHQLQPPPPPPTQPLNPTDNETSYHIPSTMIVREDQSSLSTIDSRHVNSRYVKQRIEYVDNSAIDQTGDDNNSHPFKCQMCPISTRTINELRVHCSVDHNVESSQVKSSSTILNDDNDNIQQKRRISEDLSGCIRDKDRRRISDDDT